MSEEEMGLPKDAQVLLNKAVTNDDEPVFVIRAKDNLSLFILKEYLYALEEEGLAESNMFASLLTLRASFITWRNKHPEQCKIPD